jgi:hypothetical protein
MPQDVETSCIANAAIEPDEHEEIDITPEMVEAGMIAYYDGPEWAKDGELPEGAVKRIYHAMEAARIDVGQRRQSREKDVTVLVSPLK